MKYEFGFLDYTQFMIGGTAMDCVPHFDIELKEEVVEDRLKNAVTQALSKHIIFATKVEKAKRYYLVENHGEVPILPVESILFRKTHSLRYRSWTDRWTRHGQICSECPRGIFRAAHDL